MKAQYEREGVQLWRGEAVTVLSEMADASADMLVTDPPYSSGGMVRGDRMGSTRTKYQSSGVRERGAEFTGDNRDQRAYLKWSILWMAEALRVVRPGGLVLVFTDWRQLPTTTDALQAGGAVWRGVIPWHKPAARPLPTMPSNECEYVVWGTNGPRPFEYVKGVPTWPGFYSMQAPRERVHITQKPVELMRELVKMSDGVVLDPFMGSGTTGVAAVAEGKPFAGIEMSAEIYATAEARVRAASLDAPVGPEQMLDLGAIG